MRLLVFVSQVQELSKDPKRIQSSIQHKDD